MIKNGVNVMATKYLEQFKENIRKNVGLLGLLELNNAFIKETKIDCLIIDNIYEQSDMMSFIPKIEIDFRFGSNSDKHYHISVSSLEDAVENIKTIWCEQLGNIMDNITSISANDLLRDLIYRFDNEYYISIKDFNEYHQFLTLLNELAQLGLERLENKYDK